jgi:2-polyprenyl-6-methoxyphenol hydroxylase-like FAD-dependent oxidoreductase
VAEITVLGAGVCGLATAILLARDGHGVTVLERDPAPAPVAVDDAWAEWARSGVVQFRQPHFLQARVRHVLDRELPDVRDALLASGGAVVDPVARLPAAIADRAPRDGDERFVSLTARRTTTEHVVASVAENEPRVRVRRGVEVGALTKRANGSVPHVTGVLTSAGEELASDLVVDAMGRNSKLPRWLREAGIGDVHEEAEDSGFLYYTRFFRTRDGSVPAVRTPFQSTPIGSITILTLPGDCSTWCVTIFTSSGDRPLKQLKHADRFAAVLAACPLHAHWLDGEPISDVLPMAGVLDRYRRLTVDGRLLVSGVVLVADAWACTNPSLARGLALGLDHAARLRDTVRAHLDDPRELAEAWDAVTEAEFTPWYRATVATDRARLAEIDRLRRGEDAPPPPADRAALARSRLAPAATRDPDLFRAFLEIVCCLTLPADVFARPGLVDRVLELTETGEPPAPPGPTREQLLALLA